ncbi:MAG: glycosyltransferase, partial [Rhodoglobus sp.]|nr:glycosyltransferase [Rhodoglobus sp.]
MTAQWTAIVLYYRHGPDTARTIEDLVNQSVSPKNIILVDNDSNDGVCAKIVSENPQATLLSLPRNMGYAAAMNLAAHQAEDSEWLLFATHEVRLSADAVERLLRAGEDPKTVQLAPMLGALDGSEVWSSGGTLSRLGRPAHAKVAGSESQEVTWVDGACHLVRASAFWDVAGFDESFFLYWEDIDLSVR